ISFQKGKEKSDPWRWTQILIKKSPAQVQGKGKGKKNVAWEEIFTKHFPQKSRDRFHKLNEEVNRYLEQFLIWQELDQNSLERDLVLMRAVSQRSPNMMPGILSKVRGRQEKQKRREHSYHQSRRKWLEFRFENALALPKSYPKSFPTREKQTEIHEAQQLAMAMDGVVPFMLEVSPVFNPPLSPMAEATLATLKAHAKDWPVVKTLYEALSILIQKPQEAEIKRYQSIVFSFHKQYAEGKFTPYLTLNLAGILHNQLKRVGYFHPQEQESWFELAITHYHWISNHRYFVEDARGLLGLLSRYGALLDAKPNPTNKQRLWTEANELARQWVNKLDPVAQKSGEVFLNAWKTYYQGTKPNFSKLYLELSQQSYLGIYTIEVFIIRIRVESYIEHPTPKERDLIRQQAKNLIERLGYQSDKSLLVYQQALKHFLGLVRSLVNVHSPDQLSKLKDDIQKACPIAEQAWLQKQVEALRKRGYPRNYR
ncbi:MAG: hypothetical protein AAF804_16185, partial [Bacteroidota bacterium]